MKFLANDRADIFLTPPTLVIRALKADGLSTLKIKNPPVAVYHFHTYFLEEYSDIAEKYNAALKELKKDEIYMDILKSAQ